MRASVRTAALGGAFVLLAVCGWYEAAMRPFTLESATVTFSVAAVVLVAGALYRHLSRPAPGTVAPVAQGGGPSSREAPLNVVGSLAWLLAILLALGVELWEFAHGPRSLHPTLSSLLNDVLGPGHRVVRAAAFLCWGACGFVIASRPGLRP